MHQHQPYRSAPTQFAPMGELKVEQCVCIEDLVYMMMSLASAV